MRTKPNTMTAPDQQKVIVDEKFIRAAIVNEVYRLGLWQDGRPAYCHIEARIPDDRLPAALRGKLLGQWPVTIHAELTPMYSAEEVTDAVDRR